MPCTPEKQFPGAWPESPLLPFQTPPVMEHRVSPQGDSLEESRRPPCSRGSAIHLSKKPALRIVVPPTEYCPFSTDLTLPITPHSLPTPVSSSCFTFSDTQDHVSQSALPIPPSASSSCSRDTAVADFASPTSSQFLLMPPTSHIEDVNSATAVCASALAPPAATDESTRDGFNESKSGNLYSREVSPSTWLSDLGGHTETDRIFRHNLLEITSVDTDGSPASTPALSQSAVTPSSQVSSILAYNSPTSLTRSPASLPPTLSLSSSTMSPHSSLPVRLALKPMGTDTFPSTLDSLEAWRESVTPGIPRAEEPHSPTTEDTHDSPLRELMAERTVYTSIPPHHFQPHHLSPRVPYLSRSKTFIKQAKMFGGRVKQLVTRQSAYKHRGSMDGGVNFNVITSQDSENGSVILIAAPPPPYDGRLPLDPCSPTGEEHTRTRTTSVYSSVVQASTADDGTGGMTESSPRQGGGNRNALRRLSIAALSTIKRF